MIRLNSILYAACMVLLLAIAGSASEECVADDNDTKETAQPIGLAEGVSGWVCPDDPFDFYFLEIPDGADVSGKIIFSSPQRSTVLRIVHAESDSRVLDDAFTTGEVHEIKVPVAEGILASGTYYARVFFWSEADFDHEYTLEVDLNIKASTRSLVAPGILEVEVPLEGLISTRFPREMLEPFEPRPTVPWPSKRGCATNSGRSTYLGPPGSAYKSAEYNILQDAGLTYSSIESRFAGLVAGLGDRAYIGESGANFVSYNLSTGLLRFEIMGWLPFILDGESNVYLMEYGEAHLTCMDPDGNEIWGANVPDPPTNLKAVGRRAYAVRYGGSVGENWLHAWELNGDTAWTVELFATGPLAMAEDPNVCIYFNTQDGLYQFDWDGNNTWVVPYTWTSDWMADKAANLGAIVGRDHRVLVQDPWGKRLMIFNPDGSTYGEYDYTAAPEDAPVAICLGGNRNLYIATAAGEVICFDNWTTELWRVQVAPEGGIEDMIMGQDDTIYVLYHTAPALTALIFVHRWVSLDPDTGGQIFNTNIGVPVEFNAMHRGELAIGENEKLIYLNNGGYLAVFEPGLLRYGPDLKIEKFAIGEPGG